MAEAVDESYKTLARLSQENLRFAWLFLGGFQRGDVHLEKEKTLREYIPEYKLTAKKDQILQSRTASRARVRTRYGTCSRDSFHIPG